MTRFLRRVVGMCTVLFLMASGSSLQGAIFDKVVEFDANISGSWSNATYTFHSTVGGYVMTNTTFGNHVSQPTVWGFAEYQADGAGPGNRAYLEWGKHSAMYGLGAQAADGDILNIGGTAQGYTLEAYMRFDGDLALNNLPPLGASIFGDYGESRGNHFLNLTTWNSGDSSAQTFDGAGMQYSDNRVLTTTANTSLWPYGYDGRWVHLVKTHEINGGQSIVRWYRNGELVITDSTIDYESDVSGPYLSQYKDQNENFGSLGDSNSRTLRNFGYSLFRVYRGMATSAEVSNLYSEVAQPVGIIEKVVDFDVDQPGAYDAGPRLLSSTVGGYVVTNTEWGLSGGNPAYGFATYNASGAGRDSRAYLSWDGVYGGLVGVSGSAAHGSVLNSGGVAEGYTMEAFFRFRTDFVPVNLPSIGANVFGDFSSKWGNNFINITGWSTHSNSSAQTFGPAGTKLSDNESNPNPYLFPGGYSGEWMHIVKTHQITDAGESIVRWYLDGELVLTDSTIDAATDGNGPYITQYTDAADDFGSIGNAGAQRSVKNFDYSLFRVYRGTATDAQVTALYEAVNPTPPQGTVVSVR